MKVVPTQPSDVNWILFDGLRDQDLAELEAMGMDPGRALQDSVDSSLPLAFTGLVDGVPAAVFGVAPHPTMPNAGIPWMLGTNRMLQARRELVVEGRLWVQFFSSVYPLLLNWVDSRNTVAIEWLEHMGFTFDGHNDEYVGDVLFRRFTLVLRGSHYRSSRGDRSDDNRSDGG